MKSTALLLLSLLVLLAGCSKKKSTKSEPEPDYTLEASQTIGSEGDTLVISDFSLIVPPGAFASNAALKLYASTKDKPFGDRSATRTFKLEGLPDEYSQPMKLCIKYQGTLSNEGYIAAGGMQTIPGSDELKPTFSLFPANDSSGYLCVELPAMEKSQFTFLGRSNKLNSGADGTSLMIFVGTQDYDPPKVTAHFNIYCASDLSDSWKFVLTQAVEPAYDSLKALGLNLNLVPWPINVYTLYFVEEETTRHCIFSPIYGTFNLIVNDKPMLLGHDEYLLTMRAAIIRELAHAILCTYDKEYFNVLLFHTVKINPQHYWLHHAVASWCEGKLVYHVPLDFCDPEVNNPYAPFRGMQAGAKDDMKSSLNHGGGMYSVIEFLTLNYREDVIWRIYELGIKNGMHPVEAIMNSVEDEANQWWPDFFKEYMVGGMGGSMLYYFGSIKVLADTFSINSKNDTFFVFLGDYPDLSAQIYQIRLNYADIDTIKFIAESSTVEPEDIMITVFYEYGSGLYTFFTRAIQELTIADVNQLIKDGYDEFLVVVVNSSYKSPYTGTSEIDLEVEVVPKSGFNYNRFGMGTWVTGHWYRPDSTDYVYRVNPLYCCKGYGECSGYTFTSTWDTAFIDGHSNGNATITVDPSLSKVISFSATDTTWGIYFGATETTFVSMSGADLPFYYSSPGYLEFRKDGTATCNYLLSLDYTVTSSLGGWVDVADYWCDSTSYMVITLYNE
jgi:hypothetical protein